MEILFVWAAEGWILCGEPNFPQWAPNYPTIEDTKQVKKSQ